MDVHVSTMTGKLDGFRAINSNTRTNPFCLSMYENAADNVICRSCYSHEMLKAYRANTVPALQRNSDALSQGMGFRRSSAAYWQRPQNIPAR
jgi:nitrate/TMAO reductase-like tetraheme cytochrome c subunit